VTLPVSLAAAAETLRERADCEREDFGGRTERSDVATAVADLIDGMTGRHFPKQVSNWTIEHEQNHRVESSDALA
jgi:hypothetical protein